VDKDIVTSRPLQLRVVTHDQDSKIGKEWNEQAVAVQNHLPLHPGPQKITYKDDAVIPMTSQVPACM
jgi:hypothetical protein